MHVRYYDMGREREGDTHTQRDRSTYPFLALHALTTHIASPLVVLRHLSTQYINININTNLSIVSLTQSGKPPHSPPLTPTTTSIEAPSQTRKAQTKASEIELN